MSTRRLVLLILAAALAAALSMPVSAQSAVRAGSVEDPADAVGQPDVAGVTVRYDEAGAIELRVRFHEPVGAEAGETADWSATTGGSPGDCRDTRQGLAGLLDLASGETTLTYTEVSEDGIPVEVEIPARQTLSVDGRELTVVARSGTLARRAFACSELSLSSGDEVAPFALTAPSGPPASPAPDPVAPQLADSPAAGMRIARARLSFVRRRHSATAVLRARVCAPAGSRFVLVVDEARRRVGVAEFGPRRRHRYARQQRVRCQQHRFSWRFAAQANSRYQVRARVTLL